MGGAPENGPVGKRDKNIYLKQEDDSKLPSLLFELVLLCPLKTLGQHIEGGGEKTEVVPLRIPIRKRSWQHPKSIGVF